MSLKQLAKETLDLIERGTYNAEGADVSIASQTQASRDQSRLYVPEQLDALRKNRPQSSTPKVEVVDGTTQQVARNLAASGPVALLNFASGRKPGGGFLNGAKAQEEDLCRCSSLYPTLLKHEEYYRANRAEASPLYTDHIIFSPEIPFFKTRGTGDLLPDPFVASVITAPAPNTKPYLSGSGDLQLLEQCFERRWQNVLAVAQDRQLPCLLLGAWGCGAFGGDPVMASQTAKKAIQDFAPALDRIVFAIPNQGKQSKQNFAVFSETFQTDQTKR